MFNVLFIVRCCFGPSPQLTTRNIIYISIILKIFSPNLSVLIFHNSIFGKNKFYETKSCFPLIRRLGEYKYKVVRNMGGKHQNLDVIYNNNNIFCLNALVFTIRLIEGVQMFAISKAESSKILIYWFLQNE